ncbi:MAG: peptidoglycan-associated lipoprotein Pal [Desulfobacteraceae bacterium]|nr:peptidoglycan-associated lipoprotein Pal [Desulfobacteraceae bacterium]
MRKKLITGVIALAFVCSSLLLVTSCAKKQVQVSEPTIKAEEQEKAAAEERAKRAGEAEQQAKLRAEEAEQQAKLRAEEAAREAKQKEERLSAQSLADAIKTFESEHIYFVFDKYDLLHYARVVLKDKAAWLRANPGYSVWIEGHCDERGTSEYNLALGERRADAAMKFLVALGISKNSIKTISYGEERPADLAHNEQAWSKNRRAEFKLFKTK